jgi:hypothetical protein
MKFSKVYDTYYKNLLVGYACEKCFIAKDSHFTWSGSEVCEGYSVETEQFGGKRLFYARTLKEAKAFAEDL